MKRSGSHGDIPLLVSKAAKIGNAQDVPLRIQSTSPIGLVEELKHDSTEDNLTHSDQTPLLVTAKEKNEEEAENVVPLLLHHGVDANFRHTECIQIILEYNASPNLNKFLKFLLIAAANDGHVECLKIFLSDPNMTMKLRVIPLIVATRNGYPECVKTLLDYNANQNLHMDKLLNLLLITAVKNGHAECLEALLDCNVDSNLNTKSLEILLTAASENGHAACAKVLLDYHADPNLYLDKSLEEPFLFTVENYHAECLKVILDYTADPNLNTDELSETPLIGAVKYGNAVYIKLLLIYNAVSNLSTDKLNLLHYSADPNKRPREFQKSPLIAAAENGHTECVKLLLHYSANPNLCILKFPESPLIAAATNGHAECVKILLDYNADPNLKTDEIRRLPLNTAAEYGHTECVKLLLHYGADPNLRLDEFHGTPLIAAVEHGHAECVKILLDYSADPNLCVHVAYLDGKVQALGLAVFHGYSACIKLLLEKIDLQFLKHCLTVPDFLCPLQLAVMYRRYECLETLLSRGYPVDSLHPIARNQTADLQFHLQNDYNILALSHHETALSLAVYNGDLESMKILLEHGASVNPICLSINYNDVYLYNYYSYPPIFSALLSEHGKPDFLIELGCDISCHCDGVPTNECLLFSFDEYNSTLNLLKWGSDPHLLFQEGMVKSQQYFVQCLANDMVGLSQSHILDILELLLQFTAVTGPVQRSFQAVSVKCKEILDTEYNAERWNEVLKEVDKPSSLKNLCRIKMRQSMISKYGYSSFRVAINNLCFPQVLKKYLLYSELDD